MIFRISTPVLLRSFRNSLLMMLSSCGVLVGVLIFAVIFSLNGLERDANSIVAAHHFRAAAADTLRLSSLSPQSTSRKTAEQLAERKREALHYSDVAIGDASRDQLKQVRELQVQFTSFLEAVSRTSALHGLSQEKVKLAHGEAVKIFVEQYLPNATAIAERPLVVPSTKMVPSWSTIWKFIWGAAALVVITGLIVQLFVLPARTRRTLNVGMLVSSGTMLIVLVLFAFARSGLATGEKTIAAKFDSVGQLWTLRADVYTLNGLSESIAYGDRESLGKAIETLSQDVATKQQLETVLEAAKIDSETTPQAIVADSATFDRFDQAVGMRINEDEQAFWTCVKNQMQSTIIWGSGLLLLVLISSISCLFGINARLRDYA